MDRADLKTHIQTSGLEDLLGGSGLRVPDELKQELLAHALERWQNKLEQAKDEPQKAWEQVVREFHAENYWGFKTRIREFQQKPKTESPSWELFHFVRVFFIPTFITKVAVFYFGIHYAMHPGEGYGWGLAISLAVTAFNLIYFAVRRSRKKSS